MGRYLEALRNSLLPLGDTPPRLPEPPPGSSCVGFGGTPLGENAEIHAGTPCPLEAYLRAIQNP